MFEPITRLVNRRGWLIVVGWIAATAVLHLLAPSWETVSRDDDVRFFPEGYPSVRGQHLLERGFPDDASSSQAVLVAERRGGPLTDRDFAYVRDVARRLDQLRREERLPRPSAGAGAKPAGTPAATDLGIRRIVTYNEPLIGPRLIGTAADGKGQAVLTIISLEGTYQSKRTRLAVDRLYALLDELPAAPEGLALGMTGSAAVGHDMNTAANESVGNTTTATILLVVLILLFVYRSPLLALIPLATISLSVWASLLAIALLTKLPGLNFQVINITNIFVIVVLFGAGTDYCLFLIARYREELARGRTGDEALGEAIRRVAGAVIASAGTVIFGLGMLWFSSFAKIQYTGPSIALSLAIALVAALTLAPVLLHWLRGAVFWPFQPPHHTRGRDPEAEGLEQMPLAGFWAQVADLVVRYPARILAVSLLALAPFAVVGYFTRASYSQLADLRSDQPSVRGARMIQRYFAVGELSPTTVLIDAPRTSFRSPAGRAAIDTLSRRLAALSEMAEVRSVTQPLGQPVGARPSRPARSPARSSPGGFFNRIVRQGVDSLMETPLAQQGIIALAESRYVSANPRVAKADFGHITRLDLIFKRDPFSPESLVTLREVEQTVNAALASEPALAGATAGLTGSTVMIDDLRKVTTHDERKMYWLVTIGVYVILVVLLRRPGICLYLIATVVLGYLASLGITDLVFRNLGGGAVEWSGLDWKVGFFLFVILVAVGEDYNIFLMSRVIEEERKHGPIEGTRRAVAHTGGIISSCGLIMAGTFGSMLTASLMALRELGFALGLGVLLDTFVVRPILVPAFVVLIHRGRYAPAAPVPQAAAEPATTTAP